MPNKYTRKEVGNEVIARRYAYGESLHSIAQELQIDIRRVKRAVEALGLPVRSSSAHLKGNTHRKKYQLTESELIRLYVDERLSIKAIEGLTGCTTVHYLLRQFGIPRRTSTSLRLGVPAPISQDGLRRLSVANTGRNHWNWKGGSLPETARYYHTAEWRKLALACKMRDNFSCQICGKILPQSRLRAHHIIPRRDGGVDAMENLVTYCNPCHIHSEPRNTD